MHPVSVLLLLSTFLIPTFAATCYSNLTRTEFPYCTNLDPRFALHWAVQDGGHITFGATVDVDDAWFAVGLSASGGMKGASIYVIGRNDSGLDVTRYWSQVYGPPSVAANQNVEFISATSGNGTTTAIWRRPLNTCDDQDIPVEYHRKQAVIWAIGTSWTLQKHMDGNRGSTYITFQPDPNVKPPPVANDTKSFTLKFDNFIVPNKTVTNYICTHKEFQFPDNSTKYHLIHSQAFHTQPTIHHMILYGCTEKPPAFDDAYECFNLEPNCNNFLIGWAPGLDVLDMPAEAAFPLGNGGYKYFSVQAHYNNANLTSGIKDNSGFNISYTAQLRPYDMGILTLGNEDLVIPPNKTSYTAPGGQCPSECTKNRMTQPVTMYRNLFHMHGTGRNMSTRHIRDGRELQPLGAVNYFDYKFQTNADLSTGPRLLLPGDELITTCTYDSRSRTNTTRFGPGTIDEMCFNFLLYYPAMSNFDSCYTQDGYATCASGKVLADAYYNLTRAVDAAGSPQGKAILYNETIKTLVDNGVLYPLNNTMNFTVYNDTCVPVGMLHQNQSSETSTQRRSLTDSPAVGLGAASMFAALLAMFH